MTLITLILKVVILVLGLRDTFGALRTADLADLGRSSKPVKRAVRLQDAPCRTVQREVINRQRIGSPGRRAEVRSALTVILVWNICVMLEPFCDKTLSWILPFYDSIKTLFLMWFLVTRSLGSHMLFHRFVVPFVSPYEGIIDAVIHAVAGLLPLANGLTKRLPRHIGVILSVLPRLGSQKDHSTIPTAPLEVEPSRSMTFERRSAASHNLARVAAALEPLETQPTDCLAPPRIDVRQPLSALQKGREVTQRQEQQQQQRRQAKPGASSRAELGANSKETAEETVAIPMMRRQLQLDASRLLSPGAAVGQLAQPSETLTEPRPLRNFAFIPTKAKSEPAIGPESFLSPPPKLPGHFNFAFIPPSQKTEQGVGRADGESRAAPEAAAPRVGQDDRDTVDGNTTVAAAVAVATSTPLSSDAVRETGSTTAKPARTRNRALDGNLIVAPPTRRARLEPLVRPLSPKGRSVRTPRSAQDIDSQTAASAELPAPRPVPRARRVNRPDTASTGDREQGQIPASAPSVPKEASAGKTAKGAVSLAGTKRRLAEEREEKESEESTGAVAVSSTGRRVNASPRKKARLVPGAARSLAAPSTGVRRPVSTASSTASSARSRSKSSANGGAGASMPLAAVAVRSGAKDVEARKPATRVTRSRAKAATTSTTVTGSSK